MPRLSLILFLIILTISNLSNLAIAEEKIPRRDPGEGDPIEINDIEELQRIGNDDNYPLNGVYILANDIDASETRNWNDGAGFDPIGEYGGNHPFTGTFDGNGHIISGLYINRPHVGGIGLFARTDNEAVIENIGLTDVEISGRYVVGGLVGYNRYSMVSNSYVIGNIDGGAGVGGLVGQNSSSSFIFDSYTTVSVNGRSDAGGLVGGNYRSTISSSYATGRVQSSEQNDWGGTGGLVGHNECSVISNSYATGNVDGQGQYYIGGLVGNNVSGSTISRSYATGRVSGGGAIGGLVGYNSHINTTISNSYATGDVDSDEVSAGGLVGSNVWASISNCYATGNVSGQERVGGLVGRNEHGVSISESYAIGSVSGANQVGGLVGFSSEVPAENYQHNYWDTETTGRDNGIGNIDDEIDGVQGRTTDEMMEENTFEDWDFDEAWFMPGAEQNELSFPHLQMEEAVHHHSFIAQDIDLGRGWNMLSFNTQPDIRDLSYIFRDIEGLIILKDERGNFFYPERNFDNIGEMSLEEGYQVKLSQPAQLHIFGKAAQLPFSIPLTAGWNIMGYPLTQEQPAMDVLRQLTGAEIDFLIKDELGRFIYPRYDFYGFEALRPGEGYHIRVSRDVDLAINPP